MYARRPTVVTRRPTAPRFRGGKMTPYAGKPKTGSTSLKDKARIRLQQKKA